MRKKAVQIGKKTIPAWLLVMALTLAGAGAAVGTVLAPKITGEIPVTVSQALLVENVAIKSSTPVDESITTVSDDKTAFTVGVELNNGDYFKFNIPIINESSQDIVGKLTFWNVPKGITLDVSAKEAFAVLKDSDTDGTYEETRTVEQLVTNVTRVGKYTWLFKVDKDAEGLKTYTVNIQTGNFDDDGDEEDVKIIVNGNQLGAIQEDKGQDNTKTLMAKWDGTNNRVVLYEDGNDREYIKFQGEQLSVTVESGDQSQNLVLKVTVAHGVDVTVALADNMKPGFYEIKGRIEPVNY